MLTNRACAFIGRGAAWEGSRGVETLSSMHNLLTKPRLETYKRQLVRPNYRRWASSSVRRAINSSQLNSSPVSLDPKISNEPRTEWTVARSGVTPFHAAFLGFGDFLVLWLRVELPAQLTRFGTVDGDKDCLFPMPEPCGARLMERVCALKEQPSLANSKAPAGLNLRVSIAALGIIHLHSVESDNR